MEGYKGDSKYKILCELISDVLFELDFATNHLECTNDFSEISSYGWDYDNFPNTVFESGKLCKDCYESFRNFWRQLKRGTSYIESEFAVEKSQNDYVWYKIKATTLYNDNNAPVSAIGSITNITSEKQRLTSLIEKAERDALTGIYNKGTATTLIKKALEENITNKNALIIIDLDNFKTLNDTFGHHFGDAVLIKASEEIQNLQIENKIAGRIGGDEFIIFIPNYQDKQQLLEKINALLDAFCKDYEYRGTTLRISASIGIACFPQDGIEYTDLFLSADIAMYKSKDLGGNNVVIFNKSLQQE